MLFDDCIRCGEAPGIDDDGYCAYCHWAVKAELEEGLRQLRNYLTAWAPSTTGARASNGRSSA